MTDYMQDVLTIALKWVPVQLCVRAIFILNGLLNGLFQAQAMCMETLIIPHNDYSTIIYLQWVVHYKVADLCPSYTWVSKTFSLALHVPVHIHLWTWEQKAPSLRSFHTCNTMINYTPHQSNLLFMIVQFLSLCEGQRPWPYYYTSIHCNLTCSAWMLLTHKIMSNGRFDLCILPVLMLVIYSSVSLFKFFFSLPVTLVHSVDGVEWTCEPEWFFMHWPRCLLGQKKKNKDDTSLLSHQSICCCEFWDKNDIHIAKQLKIKFGWKKIHN